MKTVYDAKGQEYQILGTVNARTLVQEVVEVSDEDGRHYEPGGLRLIDPSNLFETPPRHLIDSRIAELQELRASLLQQVRELQDEKMRIEKTNLQLRESLGKENDVLQYLDDLLNDRFRFFVTFSEYRTKPEIEPLELDDRIDKCLKALSWETWWDASSRTKKRALRWKLNRWSDGSGVWTYGRPCKTEEEGREIAREMVVDRLKGADAKTYLRHLETITEYGIPIPDAIRAEFSCIREAEEAEAEARRNQEIKRLEQQITALRNNDATDF